jgi:hypothetical protein
MPTLGGGLTFFVDRFFIDFSAQRAFNGSDNDKSTFSSFREGNLRVGDPNIFVNDERDYDADFDRDDYAISLGYSITDQLAVYAGYKWSKADFKFNTSGSVDYLATPSFILQTGENDFVDNLDGTTASRFDYDVKYDGPFVGLTYGLNVDQSYLKGNFSFNFAVAFLDGKTKQKVKSDSVTITSIDGIDRPPFTVDLEEANFKTEGDTIGLTFGVNWRGSTPIEGLSYSLGVNAYNYQFDANNSEDPDFSETTVGFKAGVAYSF